MIHQQIMNYSLHNTILNRLLQSVQIAFPSCPSEISYVHFLLVGFPLSSLFPPSFANSFLFNLGCTLESHRMP